jgi:Fe-S-cluster containining protein
MSALDELHDEADALARRVADVHGARLLCKRGCFDCCVDGITVFEVEAQKIRDGAAELLANGTPHAAGRCAFVGSEGECRIYALRPYVCRTQGLPLRWIDEELQAELRDICPLNEEGEPIEALAEDACWTIGPFEERLARLQEDGKRVALRSLWER